MLSSSSKRRAFLRALANLTQNVPIAATNAVSTESETRLIPKQQSPAISRKLKMSDLLSIESRISRFCESNQDADAEAVVIAINQSRTTNTAVDKIMEILDDKGFHVSLLKGTLIVEFASNVHQEAVGTIIRILSHLVNGTAKVSPGSQMQVGPNSRKESDVMFRARDRATNGPREEDGREYPTLICEVAYTHPATYDELSDLLSDWLSAYTTVMIAIGIKIGIDNVKKESTLVQKSRLCFIMKIRNNPVPVEREFGPGFCDADGNQDFMIQLPSQLLFDRAPLPQNIPANVFLNLFQLKREILDSL